MPSPRCRSKAARHLPSLSSSISTFLAATALAASPSAAFDFNKAPAANLDFSRLGKVGIAGDFAGISLYEYEGQNEATSSTDGSESLLAQLPNGAFASFASSDASIQSLCTYTRKNGDVAGLILGGNFTSLDREEAPSIALFDPDTREIKAIDGLEGQVNALYCDQETDMVYLGGGFKVKGSTNAVAWHVDDGWVELPFDGFNGPVATITRASNGHIIFGGDFTSLKNTSTNAGAPDEQIINISDADITSGSSASSRDFTDPTNIVCPGDGADGPGNTWLLDDDTPGFWAATFGFEFQPSKIRLRNTHQDGRGTKTWRFTVLPDSGILNMTYIDPESGENRSCTNECPLSDDPDVPFQDFNFANPVRMNSFRIDISEHYGAGGGLNGVELFGEDVFSYAVGRFNEPACAGLDTAASSTTTGPWEEASSADSNSKYLSSRLRAPITEESASIVFFPRVKESGNYSVNVYTPGCIGDGSCGSRGQVNVSGVMSGDDEVTFSTSLYQTNNYDKYDQVYIGYIDGSSPEFRPSITITPQAGQSLDEMVIVAQRVGFSLINATGDLRGMFDYDPSSDQVDLFKLDDSPINQLASNFDRSPKVLSLVSSGDVLYVGGEFNHDDADNVLSINTDNERISSLGGGLDGPVVAMHLEDSKLYVGGEFSKARGGDAKDLGNVAVYDTKDESWGALGAGVNGHIHHVVPLKIEVDGEEETAIAFSGHFSECLKFDDNPASDALEIAVWVPSKKNWLQNLDKAMPSYSGVLTASVLDVDGEALYAGSLSASQVGATGAATLTDGKLGRFPAKILPKTSESSSVRRRELITAADGASGVLTGTYYDDDGKDFTVLAGRFSVELSDGTTVNNLVIIDGKDDDKVSGLGSGIGDNSTFGAVAVRDNVLYAGGLVSGTVDGDRFGGIIAYNLDSKSFPEQPPPLSGGESTVSAITVQPNKDDIFVGGSFTQAGSLPCPGVCIYSAEKGSWSQPGVNVRGTVHAMTWTSDTVLAVAGSLTVDGKTETPLATYDTEKQTWSTYPNSNDIPGPVEAMTLGSSDGNQLWIAGHADDNSVFIMKYDGSKWLSAPDDVLPESSIRSMQVFSLTEKHGSTDLLSERQSLVLAGSIQLRELGPASAVVFNGDSFQPYALTTGSGGSEGSIAKFFTQSDDFFTARADDTMPLVFVVLIGLAISLGLMLIIVGAGVAHDRVQKRREGYVPVSKSMIDRGSGIRRVPPGQLFESLGRERPDVPHV